MCRQIQPQRIILFKMRAFGIAAHVRTEAVMWFWKPWVFTPSTEGILPKYSLQLGSNVLHLSAFPVTYP